MIDSPKPGVGERMAYYRLYFMDRFSGHIDHYREFDAVDDGAAMALAERWREGCAMELWNRHCKLNHWPERPLVAE